MNIPPALGIVIMANNYLHSVATALLLASGVALWAIMKKYDDHPQKDDPNVIGYFLSLFGSMTRVAKLSLLWIVVGGFPRAIFYKDFEWLTAVKHGQVPALIANHVLVFAFLGIGILLWIRLRKRVRKIEEKLSPKEA